MHNPIRGTFGYTSQKAMEGSAAVTGLKPDYLLPSSRRASPFLHSYTSSRSSFHRKHSSPFFHKVSLSPFSFYFKIAAVIFLHFRIVFVLQFQKKLRLPSFNARQAVSPIRCRENLVWYLYGFLYFCFLSFMCRLFCMRLKLVV